MFVKLFMLKKLKLLPTWFCYYIKKDENGSNFTRNIFLNIKIYTHTSNNCPFLDIPTYVIIKCSVKINAILST